MQLAFVQIVTCSSNKWYQSQQHSAEEHGQKVLAWQSSYWIGSRRALSVRRRVKVQASHHVCRWGEIIHQ